ncbi:DUF202 domain-containing protein [Nocardioides zeae]|uniref:DUF202 domain-containing protein n=1 Tax=Nocardioides imazamoxiresistens TaxID=3231893 RepID=A0ABU3PUF3_9ACTN|nr:DUF202 domain-containing protein [Nocardioides zeae]MDT9592799.1 DUF202 domain-containing protein [Nocardioides zeae]
MRPPGGPLVDYAVPNDRGAQAERTTMAWVRTALALEAVAVLAARALQLRASGLVLALVASFGVAVFVLFSLRRLHGRRTRQMTDRHDGPARPRAGAPVVVSLSVVALCGAAAALLVVDGPR